MTMGARIKNLRKNAGMTQQDLADHLGIGRSAVLKYEKGEVLNIPYEKISKIASLFDVSPEYILAFSNDEKTSDVTFDMAKNCLISSYGEDAFVLLERYSRLTNKNKKKLLDLCEDIEKAERYDSAKQMFK